MQEKQTLHRWLLTAWVILWGWTASFAFEQAYGTTLPAYTFQSTSAYMRTVSSSAYTSTISTPFAAAPTRVGHIRKSLGDPEDGTSFGDPEGESGQGYAIGEIADPAPIGDVPFALMAVLVGIYAILMKKRKKVKNYLHNS